MRITFQRMGGFAGLRLSTTLESQNLEQVEVDTLEEEIKQANFFELPEQIQSTGGEVDRFEYHISVEWHQNEHTVVVAESAMPASLRPFIEHLERLMRSRR